MSTTLDDKVLINRLLEMLIDARSTESLAIEKVRESSGLDVLALTNYPGEYAAEVRLQNGQDLILESYGIGGKHSFARLAVSLKPDVVDSCPLRHRELYRKLVDVGFTAKWGGGREGSIQVWKYSRQRQTITAMVPPNTTEDMQDVCVFDVSLNIER